jgi:hypothetical protein
MQKGGPRVEREGGSKHDDQPHDVIQIQGKESKAPFSFPHISEHQMKIRASRPFAWQIQQWNKNVYK